MIMKRYLAGMVFAILFGVGLTALGFYAAKQIYGDINTIQCEYRFPALEAQKLK